MIEDIVKQRKLLGTENNNRNDLDERMFDRLQKLSPRESCYFQTHHATSSPALISSFSTKTPHPPPAPNLTNKREITHFQISSSQLMDEQYGGWKYGPRQHPSYINSNTV